MPFFFAKTRGQDRPCLRLLPNVWFVERHGQTRKPAAIFRPCAPRFGGWAGGGVGTAKRPIVATMATMGVPPAAGARAAEAF